MYVITLSVFLVRHVLSSPVLSMLESNSLKIIPAKWME